MTEVTLERLAKGIAKAHEAGDTATVQKLAPAYRQLQAQQQQAPKPDAKSNGAFSGWGKAFYQGVDQPLENLGATADALGYEGLGDSLKDATVQDPNYDSATGRFMNGEEGGYDLNYLPKAAVEQFGQFAGSIMSRAVGAGLGAAVGGAPGAVAGGIAAPAMFEGLQVLGPVATERAKNNGREEPNREDWLAALGTATASGALNSVAPNSTGLFKRMFLEAGTEAAQSVVGQTGETAATDKGWEVSAKEAIGEGILGGTAAGGVDATVKGVAAASEVPRNIRTDKKLDNGAEFNDADRGLVDIYEEELKASGRKLGNVTTTEAMSSDQGLAKGVERRLRAGMENRLPNLIKIAKERGLSETVDDLKTLRKQSSNVSSASFVSSAKRVQEVMGDIKEANEFLTLSEMNSKNEQFTQGKGDIGGISGNFTRLIDIMDGRNDSIAKSSIIASTVTGSFFTSGALLTAMPAGFAINRLARGVDNITNRRSSVKRYVDSVNRSGIGRSPAQGDPSASILDQYKAQAQAAKLAQKQGSAGPAMQSKPNAEMVKQFSGDPVAPVFDDSLQDYPDRPQFDPYRRWEQATGMKPVDILDTLEQMAREGEVAEDVPQRFREDIRSFSTKKGKGGDTYAIQELVTQRANPEYSPRTAKPKGDPDEIVKRLNMSDQKVDPDNWKEKAKRGIVARRNVDSTVKNAGKNLPTKQYQALMKLAADMDDQEVTRSERFSMMNKALGNIFRGQPGMKDIWSREFTDLAIAGNEFPVERKTEQEAEQEEAFDKKVEKAKTSKKKKKRNKTADTKQPVDVPTPPKTPEVTHEAPTRLLEHDPSLDQSNTVELPKPNNRTTADNQQKAKEPVVPKPNEIAQLDPEAKPEPKPRGRVSLKDQVLDRVNIKTYAMLDSQKNSGKLRSFIEGLGKSSDDRVVGIIVESGNDMLTQNMVTDQYAKRFNVPPAIAAQQVNEALTRIEAKGAIKRYKPFMQSVLKQNGKFKTYENEDGKKRNLEVISVEVVEGGEYDISEPYQISKSVNMAQRFLDPKSSPSIQFQPGQLSEGPYKAIKGYEDSEVDDSFRPILDFVQSMRESRMTIHPEILSMFEDAVNKSDGKRVGTISDVLRPVIDYRTVTDKKGKQVSKPIQDNGPRDTLAHILFQHGGADQRTDTSFRQEWHSGANGRVYSKNGMAHIQSGDLMKGLTRLPEKSVPGSSQGLDFIFHSIGNLLGADKESPANRRNLLFTTPGMIDNLIKFANDPFAQSKLSRNGKLTAIGKIVNGGEGFTQVLNAAVEVRDMVKFARKRFPKKAKLSNERLLRDPEVRSDLAANYNTDFIVQLDASNNAYQLAGLAMGYSDVLAATGLQPREGIDPDTSKGADIYMEPAKSIVARIPMLSELQLPDSKVRKLFKGPIGTFLYEAAFNSRKEAFREKLNDFAEGAPLMKIEGQEDGLITITLDQSNAMKSEEGYTFSSDKYDQDGRPTEVITRKRVRGSDKGFFIQTASGEKGAWKDQFQKFETEEDAIKGAFEMDLYVQMSRELVRDMNVRFPKIRQYIGFAQAVADEIKAAGGTTVKVPSPDGIMLKQTFKEDVPFEKADVSLGDKVVPLGVRSKDTGAPTGRGLAAFMMHQLDAYVLRETYKRAREKGLLENGFNPIHDSYGMAASDAEGVRDIWTEVMFELGSPDYNIFHDILEANGLSVSDYARAGLIPDREGVEPVPASQIPTALS